MTTKPIIPRALDVDLAPVPRHWLAGQPVATAIANGVNLLFPHGERFFVRSVKHFLDRIEDPALRAQIKGFFGQEGRHAREHERWSEIMRRQGYEVDRFLSAYEAISRRIEDRMSPELRLAVTAACEHFTAILAEGALQGGMLDLAAPEMRALLAWHAAEEIEHKAVAFDALRAVAPSYALRVLGLAIATALLGGFWLWAAVMLLRQEGLGGTGGLRRLRRTPAREPVIRRVFLRGIREYLRPGFHPSQAPNEDLAAAWFAARGMSMPEAA
jgi:predicted metal-dependent hydrolase